MKKTLAIILCVVTLIGVLQMPMFAAESDIMPLNNNTAISDVSFVIDSNGLAIIDVGYTGYYGVTTGGTITTKLQKRFMGVFWSTVDIGTEDKVWVDQSSEYDFSVEHTYQLEDTGTYRVVVNFVISGTGGADDEIELTRQATW
ncbi:MAG: hypothetical protein IJX39_08100 [Clostridia bacterium]|nr:hypothetical protein [Clostridia bacterium]